MATEKHATVQAEVVFSRSMPPLYYAEEDNAVSNVVSLFLHDHAVELGTDGDSVDLKVQTTRKVVTLWGTASSQGVRKRLEELVDKLRGMVDTHKPGMISGIDLAGVEAKADPPPEPPAPGPLSDDAITAKVTAIVCMALQNSALPGELIDLNASTSNGVVTLTGYTNSMMLFRRMGELVERVKQQIPEIKRVDATAVRQR